MVIDFYTEISYDIINTENNKGYVVNMNREFVALLFKEGGKILSSVVDVAMTNNWRKTETPSAQISTEAATKPPEETIKQPATVPPPVLRASIEIIEQKQPVNPGTPIKDEVAYRFECLTKHLGAASVLFKEAYERAIGDEGVGDGTAEKVMEALNEHAGMEADIEHMLIYPQVVDEARYILDATRKLRRAAWDCRITVGQGTVDDIAAAREWNSILFQRAYASAKAYPGTDCVQEGM